MNRIVVVGAGYVGLSVAIMLSQSNEVTILDIDDQKINAINNRKSPFVDERIDFCFNTFDLNLKATQEIGEALDSDAEIVVIALPTDYDANNKTLDTSCIDEYITEIALRCPEAYIVIKSTLPIGYINRNARNTTNQIIYCPEFLRETTALDDCLNPNRVVVGVDENDDMCKKAANHYVELIRCVSEKKDFEVFITGYLEAEAIKLFSNAYLAMRVCFFNELDNFAIINNAKSVDIINGICSDYRIGNYYNNPSFGYGGYCLPKDVKELIDCYPNSKECIFSSVVCSNKLRIDIILNDIKRHVSPNDTMGIYKLSMKKKSDNTRNSSMISLLKELVRIFGQSCIIVFDKEYDECLDLLGVEFVSDIEQFKKRADIIIANRVDEELEDSIDKVYSRDVFGLD